jgi:hypothetical protein
VIHLGVRGWRKLDGISNQESASDRRNFRVRQSTTNTVRFRAVQSHEPDQAGNLQSRLRARAGAPIWMVHDASAQPIKILLHEIAAHLGLADEA